MKKIFLVAAMALISAVGFSQSKFAHVDLNTLVQLMPEMDAARVQMNASQQEAQETYQAMVEEFQTKYSQYQQKAATWTDTIRQSKEKELNDMDQRIQEFQASISQELQEQQNALLQPIYEKAQEVVTKLGKEGGYMYVSDATAFYYVDESQSVDLTPAARKLLNIPEGRTLETLQAELAAQQAAQ